MTKKIGIGCIGAICIMIVLAIIAAVAGGSGDDATAPKAAAVAPLAVTAKEIAAAYSANEAAAQAKYAGKPLLVSGTIAAITLDVMDKPMVQLASGNEYMPANANLIDADQPKAASLSKGNSITLLCQDVSEVISIPQFADCAIQ